MAETGRSRFNLAQRLQATTAQALRDSREQAIMRWAALAGAKVTACGLRPLDAASSK